MNLEKQDIEKLWDEITPKLYGYLFHKLKDEALAEDILQNSWLKALEALPTYENRGFGFSAWLFSIAKNEMRMHWRKDGREVRYEEETHNDYLKTDFEGEEKIYTEQILSGLREEDQELLRLRFIADLPYEDIGKLLGLNSIATRVKVHRALGRAKDLFKQKHEEL